ncbi:MAG: PEGA domain-containing protein [Myxococcales bacterium]|nr:PEGA domain-containing protein [Myxococcales bacterium]MCB9520026.1 PEGA domain-containing protein [Myxococcales bacterium]
MRTWLTHSALILALTVGASALADDLDAARSEFWAGNEAYASEDYRTALEHFELANELSPNPRLLEYMARCQMALGDLPAALARLREYAATEPEGLDDVLATIADVEREMIARAVDDAREEVDIAVARAMGEQPQPINRLRQRLGTSMRDVPVQVLSEPRGADVFIDGVEFGAFGITPLTTPLFTGPHLIEVRKDYYEPEQRVINVTVPGPGESIPVLRFNLRRMEIPVELQVVPMTANVTFVSDTGERRPLGSGGYEGTLPAGPCTFVVQNAGRDRRVEEVLMLPEDEEVLQLTVHLDNQVVRSTVAVEIGTLRVVTQLVDGTVWVDGRQIATTPGTAEADLATGSHTVEVRRDGYTPFVQTVDITGDRETVLYVNSLERGRRR